MKVSVNGVEAFVATGGREFDPASPAVVLIHGAGFDHSCWALHSRWFAHQADVTLPHPPKGTLAGGPNSGIQDPVAQALFGRQGCAPQMCYVDDGESWSTNEITINWNAALAQYAAWLADH